MGVLIVFRKLWSRYSLFEWVIFILILLASTNVLRIGFISAGNFLSHAHTGYYAVSHLLIDKKVGPQIYEMNWFIEYSKNLTGVSEVFGPNLPTMVFVAFPAAFFSLPVSRVIWTFEHLIFAGLGFYFLGASIVPKLPRWFYGVYLAFALIFPPLVRNLELGQAYLMPFFLLSLGLYGLRYEKAKLTGISFAFAFLLKSAGPLVWFCMVLGRKWKSLAWGVGTIFLVSQVTLPWIGLPTWGAYLGALRKLNTDPTLAATAYQSMPGILTHLFRYHEIWSPTPLIHLPDMPQILIPLIGITTLGFTLWTIRNASMPLQFASLLVVNTWLVPLVEEHQLILLLIPITLLAADLWARPTRDYTHLMFLFSLFLFIVPFPYKDPRFVSGGWALLAYPRLYGSLFLWGVALKRTTQ